MKNFYSIIFIILSVFLIHPVCFSQETAATQTKFVSSGSFEIKNIHLARKKFNLSGDTAYINGKIQGKWKLWPLLNEPVEYSVAAWDINSVAIMDENKKFKTYYPCGDNKTCRDANMIPWQVMNKVRIYNLKIRFRVKSQNRKTLAVYIADPGVMASPGLTGKKISDGTVTGKNSFNAPGSPNWDKLFPYYNPDGGFIPTDTFYRDEKDGEYYARKGYAQQLFKNGVSLVSPDIVEMKIDVTSVKLWLEKKEREKKEKQLREKHKKQIADLNRKKSQEEREADAVSSDKPAFSRPAEPSTDKSLLSDFEQELLTKDDRNNNTQKNRSTGKSFEDAFAQQLDQQLFKAELSRKYKALFRDLEKKQMDEKQEMHWVFEKRHQTLLNEKKIVDDFIWAHKDKIISYVLPEEELIPFQKSSVGYGYKNAAGKVVIAPQYFSANRFELFNEKYALVQNDIISCNGPGGLNNYFIIDRKGNPVTPLFMYNQFPTNDSIEISIVKSFKKPRKVYANKKRNNLRNKYLKWEYQTKMQMDVIRFDSNFNIISRSTEWINDNGNWYWMKKCFNITKESSYD